MTIFEPLPVKRRERFLQDGTRIGEERRPVLFVVAEHGLRHGAFGPRHRRNTARHQAALLVGIAVSLAERKTRDRVAEAIEQYDACAHRKPIRTDLVHVFRLDALALEEAVQVGNQQLHRLDVGLLLREPAQLGFQGRCLSLCHPPHGTIPAVTSGRNKNIKIKDLYARFRVVPVLCAGFAALACPAAAAAIEAEVPGIVLDEVPFEITVTGVPAGAPIVAEVDGQRYPGTADDAGTATLAELVVSGSGRVTLAYASGAEAGTVELRVMPGWISLLPAFTAIAVALIIRSVVPALLLGIWFGATALQSFSLKGAGIGLLDSFEVFVANAVADVDHAAIILFTMMIGGMVGIITRNGGMMASA